MMVISTEHFAKICMNLWEVKQTALKLRKNRVPLNACIPQYTAMIEETDEEGVVVDVQMLQILNLK